MEMGDIWDESDLTVSEESNDSRTVQVPKLTRQFTNTLKDNKGKLTADAQSDFEALPFSKIKHLSVKNVKIKSVEKEIEVIFDRKEGKENSKIPILPKNNLKKAVSTVRERKNPLDDLRGTPSCEILKELL